MKQKKKIKGKNEKCVRDERVKNLCGPNDATNIIPWHFLMLEGWKKPLSVIFTN